MLEKDSCSHEGCRGGKLAIEFSVNSGPPQPLLKLAPSTTQIKTKRHHQQALTRCPKDTHVNMQSRNTPTIKPSETEHSMFNTSPAPQTRTHTHSIAINQNSPENHIKQQNQKSKLPNRECSLTTATSNNNTNTPTKTTVPSQQQQNTQRQISHTRTSQLT